MINYSKVAGVYKLTCSKNGKIYIGKSINLKKRITRHKNCSKDLKTYPIQRAIIKYGWESFEVEILEIFQPFDKIKDNNTLLQRESYYIELLQSYDLDKGYNICKYSTDGTGVPCSEETKRKISLGNLGKKKHSEESKEKIRQANLGKKHSKETLEKLRKIGLERVLSEEFKIKRKTSGLGRKRTPEQIEKIRQANLGRTPTEETREKMRNAKLGTKQTPEHIEKIRLSRLTNKLKNEKQ